jgi:hypothetical protein
MRLLNKPSVPIVITVPAPVITVPAPPPPQPKVIVVPSQVVTTTTTILSPRAHRCEVALFFSDTP